MKYLLIALATGILVPSIAASRENSAEQTTVVFFGKNRPILFQFQVEINAKSAAETWKNYLTKWVEFLDRDGDKQLNALEIRDMPTAAMFKTLLSRGFIYRQGNRKTSIESFGKNVTQKITVDDLVEYFAKNGLTPIALSSQNYRQPTNRSPSDQALLKLLDNDADGKLSQKEVQNGLEALSKKDLDDNEMISQAELFGGVGEGYQIRTRPTTIVQNRSSLPLEFLLIKSGRKRSQLAALLLSKYDQNKDLALNHREIALTEKEFNKLDADQNNALQANELALWLEQTTPMSLQIRVGSTAEVEPGEIPKGSPKTAQSKNKSTFHLLTKDAKLSVQSLPSATAMMRTSMASKIFLQQYRIANPKNKPFLRKQDLATPRLRFLFSQFSLLDQNNDDKITEKEIRSFSDLQEQARKSFVSLRIHEQSGRLFQLLDENRDRQISLRERLYAWKNLEPFDADRDGFLSPGEFARQFVIAFAEGTQSTNSNRLQRIYQNPRPTSPRRRPSWFAKMDVNGDGDVSQREFLGTPEHFRRLDNDRDGLIDSQEARLAQEKTIKGNGETKQN